ncbi:MAG: shikimate kinase [Oscillospiraceae bacterium]|nr:shikimate kinase [Oscillospiraceae bacterium]
MNIWLCGFMGCGKTTVGGILAERLNRRFIDTDDYITQKTGMTIPLIFSSKGEAFFRERESASIKELAEERGMIIACGGGAMLKKENAEAAKQSGVIIYIDADFEECYSRIENDENRPIVTSNTKEALHEIYLSRVLLYRENSSLTVSGQGTPEDIAERINLNEQNIIIGA